jgi:hypothetical protein
MTKLSGGIDVKTMVHNALEELLFGHKFAPFKLQVDDVLIESKSAKVIGIIGPKDKSLRTDPAHWKLKLSTGEFLSADVTAPFTKVLNPTQLVEVQRIFDTYYSNNS